MTGLPKRRNIRTLRGASPALRWPAAAKTLEPWILKTSNPYQLCIGLLQLRLLLEQALCFRLPLQIQVQLALPEARKVDDGAQLPPQPVLLRLRQVLRASCQSSTVRTWRSGVGASAPQ